MAFWTNGTVARGAKAAICAVLTAGIIGLGAPAFAQEVAPEQLALARKYIDLTDNGSVFETTVVEVGIETMAQIVSQNPELMPQTDEAITAVIQQYTGRKGDLFDQFARVYALRFTLDELREIVAFYESPTGKKLASANFEVNEDVRRILQVYTNNLRTEFFAKVRAELRAKGVSI